jgi:hypothetical protein
MPTQPTAQTPAVTPATDDDFEIDFDAIDRKVAEGRASGGDPAPKTTAKPADEPEIEVVEAPAVAKSAILKPEDGLEKLKQQLEAEKAARLASDAARQTAEQHAREASAAEVEARTKTQGTELEFLTTAIGSLTRETDALESRYAEAMAAQDYAGAAKAQREMANNAAKLQRLEEGKSALEKAPKPQPRQFQDPVEQFASRLSAPAAAWIRAHPEYVRNQAKNDELLAADALARARRVRMDTPEYFKMVEDTLGLTQNPETASTIEVDTTPQRATGGRQTAPAAAPVSRAGGGQGSRPNTVRLTSEEVEMAKMMDMTPEQYAKNKIALQREGKMVN